MGLMPPIDPQNNGFAAMLMQLGPFFKPLIDKIKPLVDQPVIRFPYNMPLTQTRVIPAGASSVPLNASDFQNSLEWPFEIERIKPSQDPAHSPRDWRLTIKDQNFSQDMQKAAVMVDTLIDNNTGNWYLRFPWIMRPQGGGWSFLVDNLDTVNPITIDLNLSGYLLIPR